MSQPPSKRSRSSDAVGRRPSQSGGESESTLSRDAKYSAYKDVNYAVVLETKNSFMRASTAGIAEGDREMCDRLLYENQPTPPDSMFDADRFEEFCSHLQDRSEARVYLDLHPLLVPSAENLFIRGQRTLQHLTEGYNDRWVKAIPFYGPRPQPDHTVGFKWSAFTELQRCKLGIEPTSKSYYAAREDIYFPFLTSEVKCGKQALDLADRANANSMTIALRGVVELFRKIERPLDVHRRALAFSISHDHTIVRLYAHYPEIDGDMTSFYRFKIKQFDCNAEMEKWTCNQFTRNVYEKFTPNYLELIKGAIDQLPDPVKESFDSSIAPDDDSALSSQEIASSASRSQAGEFQKPRPTRGLNAELRTMIQSLQQQMGRQRDDAKAREEKLEKDAKAREEKLEKDAKAREEKLVAQLEQQQKDAKAREEKLVVQLERQRKESEQQLKELSQLMQQQGEQLTEILKNR